MNGGWQQILNLNLFLLWHDYRRARRVDNLWSIRGCSSSSSSRAWVFFLPLVGWSGVGVCIRGRWFQKKLSRIDPKLAWPWIRVMNVIQYLSCKKLLGYVFNGADHDRCGLDVIWWDMTLNIRICAYANQKLLICKFYEISWKCKLKIEKRRVDIKCKFELVWL